MLESLVKSKRYAVPLVSLAVLHPYFGGSLAFAWLDSAHFNPRRLAESETFSSQPAVIAAELQANQAVNARRSTGGQSRMSSNNNRHRGTLQNFAFVHPTSGEDACVAITQ